MTASEPGADSTTSLGRAWTRLLGVPAPGRWVVVVGGGPTAAWLVQGYARAAHPVVVIAPRICDDLVDLLVEHRITWEPRDPRPEDLDDAWVLHAATPDPAHSRNLRDWVASRHRWVS